MKQLKYFSWLEPFLFLSVGFAQSLSIAFIVLLSFAGCQTNFELKDIPIYHAAKLDGEVFCYAEVKFVSGEARCVPEDEFLNKVQPKSVMLTAEGFYYFRNLALKVCKYAAKEKRASCSEDVKSIDDAVSVLWDAASIVIK